MVTHIALLAAATAGLALFFSLLLAWSRRRDGANAQALEVWLAGFRARGWQATARGAMEFRLARSIDGVEVAFEQKLVETGSGEHTAWAPARVVSARLSPDRALTVEPRSRLGAALGLGDGRGTGDATFDAHFVAADAANGGTPGREGRRALVALTRHEGRARVADGTLEWTLGAYDPIDPEEAVALVLAAARTLARGE